jgi:dihydrofolate reductase
MITIISGMTKGKVIGKDGKLPWNIAEDLKNFKQLTSGNTVIMGRKTFESIGKALPNRNNIVISKTMQPIDEIEYGINICYDVNEAILKAKKYGKEIFIIGGARIYEEFLAYADRMYLSIIKKDYEGNTYFPNYDENKWEVVEIKEYEEFEFRELRKKKLVI